MHSFQVAQKQQLYQPAFPWNPAPCRVFLTKLLLKPIIALTVMPGERLTVYQYYYSFSV
jgi:hypothetical protein